MSNNTAPASKPQAPPDRTPIRIEKLIFTSPNPHGVNLPNGADGKGTHVQPNIVAGVHGSVKIEIEHRPWMRVFRVTRSQRVTRTGADNKEIESWRPMGASFHIPEAWAISVVAED